MFLPVRLSRRLSKLTAIMIAVALSCLMAGCRDNEPYGEPGFQLSLQLPADNMGQMELVIGRSDAGLVRRCVIDVFKAGSSERVMRRVCTPVIDFGGRFNVGFYLPDGEYDFRIWSDYARSDSPETDLCYATDDLDHITRCDPMPEIDISFRDAAFGYIENVRCSSASESERVGLKLTRAVGRYTVLGENVAAYLRLSENRPNRFPPVEELRLEVVSRLFLPTVFSVTEAKVLDSELGITYICDPSKLPECGVNEDDELTMADDIVFVGENKLALTIDINVWGLDWQYVGYIHGLPIEVRRDRVTVVRGGFLELGAPISYMILDKNWAEDIIIHF